ncbi:outer membrane protein assembly factor BamB [Caulobacter ginsengisoli]|uniref:Outer membrane protein assembly factor BamB n=1 Tax=Caulobacter ginsengisoli TaxID=400775 RepID=A0ABU0IU15_9CAUL|nr:PQQ-binding-like beta-propeller repeat protein [Caulobacter ginsengisoli]MDQ0465498.1 outer membrane protein assembly factor BamB [Caulobacter ginsengisoli]
MNRILKLAALLLALLTPPAALAGPATMYRIDPQGTGVQDVPTAASFKAVRFAFRTGGPIRGGPTLSGGAVLVGSADGNLYALDARTGAELWRTPAGAGIGSTPAVADGLVYVTTRRNRLLAVSAAAGKVRWSRDLGADLGSRGLWDYYTSSPILLDGVLYVGSGDGGVYAFDARSGRPIWRHDAGARVRSAPAVTEAMVVFGAMNGHVTAVDRRTGQRVWDFATDGAALKFADYGYDPTSVMASPSISGGLVTVGARDGQFYGLDLASGKLVWKTTHDGSSWIAPTLIEGDRIFVGSGSAAFLQAAALKTGAQAWRFPTLGAVFGAPCLAGGAVLIEDNGGYLYAIDKADGHELWRFALGDRSFSTPAAGGGLVYAASDAGVLYALETGTEPGRVFARRYVYAPAKAPKNFRWFQNGIDVAVLDAFKAAGYEPIDETGLIATLADPARATGSLIVFAESYAPAQVLDPGRDGAPIRRYLEAGGRVVLLGPNPAALRFDETGALTTLDYALAGPVFGFRLPTRDFHNGYYASRVTAEGERWGLSGGLVTGAAVEPGQVDRVLALDEFGMASEWVKTYGPAGGALVQLAPPRNRLTDMTPYRLAAEHPLT